MKRPNITPSPWEQSDTSIIAGDICIAVIESDGGYEAEPEVQKANAQAIAAVPELLEALEHALPGLESDLLYCERNPQLVGLDQEACLAHKRGRIAKARAALTKAGYAL